MPGRGLAARAAWAPGARSGVDQLPGPAARRAALTSFVRSGRRGRGGPLATVQRTGGGRLCRTLPLGRVRRALACGTAPLSGRLRFEPEGVTPMTINDDDWGAVAPRAADALPKAGGLFDPCREHDACGVGFIANLKGGKTHKLIAHALSILPTPTH